MNFLYLVYILLGCIVIYLFIQYAFTINEEFTNGSASIGVNIDTSSSITFNSLDDTDISYINSYIPTNSTECLNIKCGFDLNKKETNYTQYYSSHQVEFTPKEQEELSKLTKEINTHPKFYGSYKSVYSIFVGKFNKSIKWNLLKTKNLEVNLPCTLSKCILLPEKIFSSNWEYIKEILMHEQVHILQRQYQSDFNEFYKKEEIFGKFISPISKSELDISALELENIVITNPDEDNLAWIISEGTTHYIVPYLVGRSSVISTTSSMYMSNPNPIVTTNYGYEIYKDSEKNKYIVTGNKKNINDLEYMKYIKENLSNGEGVNIAHPNETFTDLFLI